MPSRFRGLTGLCKHQASGPGARAPAGPQWVSRFIPFARLKDMEAETQRFTLGAVVLLHFLVSLVHGSVHDSAGVVLSGSAMLFVVVVILAGPLAGFAWMWKQPVAGARLIGVTMAGSLVFGLINHFIIAGADRIDHVAAHWRPMFTLTAASLAAIEVVGAVLGLAYRRTVTRGVS